MSLPPPHHHQQQQLTIQQQQQQHSNQNGLVTYLSTRFIHAATYAQITRQEAMEAIYEIIETQNEHKAAQVFDLLVDHQLLVPFDQYYQVQTSTITSTSLADANGSGVFVPLTKCYSSGCTPQHPSCYSPSCPFNPNSLDNKNKKDTTSIASSLLRMDTYSSHESSGSSDYSSILLGTITTTTTSDYDIPDHLSPKERKRQAALNEILHSEKQYCHDLDILRTIYAEPLLESPAIEDTRRQRFHDIVFANYKSIYSLHKQSCDELGKLIQAQQQENNNANSYQENTHHCGGAGNIIFKHVARLMEPYALYSANHVKAWYIVQFELASSYPFRTFIEQQDAQECTRRLGIRHYLTLPTLRMGKYRLLIKALYKYTTDEGDLLSLGAALAELKDLLARMNEVTRQAEIETRRLQIMTSLRIPDHIPTTLQHIVDNDSAILLHEGRLLLARSSHSFTATPCYLFLFAHILVVTRPRDDNTFIVAGPPIPLHMLRVELPPRRTLQQQRKRIRMQQQQMQQHLQIQQQLQLQQQQEKVEGHQSQYHHNTVVEQEDSVTGLYIRARFRRFRQSLHQKTVPAEQQERFVSKRIRSPSPPSRVLMMNTNINNNSTVVNNTSRRRAHRLRMLTVSHLGYPESTYHFTCPTLEDRERWRERLVTASQNAQTAIDHRVPFGLSPLCEVATGSSRQSVMIGGSTMFPTGCGRIWCTLPFVDDDTGQAMLAMGTQYGVWVGPRDGGSQDFWLAVPHDDCQQLAILDNSILLVRAYHRRNALMAYDLKMVCQRLAIHRRWGFVRRSAVISFAVGTLDNRTVLCYLTRKRRHRHQRLVIVQYKPTNSFRKLKEFRLEVKDAVYVQVAHNTVFLLSPTQGICRISQDERWKKIEKLGTVGRKPKRMGRTSTSIRSTTAIATSSPSRTTTTMTTTSTVAETTAISGFVPFASHGGYVYDTRMAQCVSFLPAHQQQLVRTQVQDQIEFESRVQRVAIVFPYLIGFSHSIIEVRHAETGKVVQVIAGCHIRCVHASHNDNEYPTIHVSMLHPDEHVTRVYSLNLLRR
ncbi:hypothetical protein BDA99DRAFT_503196 [Phascolomyces articulosus]|uniref:Uncharacterized protein n=1 Tax=Phascolomyces articulosus TaxID=60185 RepID=A0AAD5KE46_9FUNG|nr:hypothetical protein BDA99DRAFT_503196 [Phascolomyces articulosus]